jgi:hypothetical protein
MLTRINQFFDVLDTVANRLPTVDHLIVQLILIALVVLGARALFKHHP